MKPSHVFSFTWIFFAMLAILSFVYPKNGIRINDSLSLDFPSLSDVLIPDTATAVDFSDILAEDFDIDSVDLRKQFVRDSTKERYIADSIRAWQLQLHYPNGDKSVLYPLFKSLDNAKSGSVRILHYGDSQIEGDRISGYLRNKLQSKFGGTGPGFAPSVPLVPSAGFGYSSSENWKRYTLYGKIDTLVKHSKYGPLASFGRFTEIVPDSLIHTAAQNDSIQKASLTFASSKISYGTTKIFNQYDLLFGNNKLPVTVRTYLGDSLIKEQRFPETKGLHVLSGQHKSSIKEITFEFEGHDSPDVYGVNLSSGAGVVLDNIALRGSSGTIFKKMDSGLLRKVYGMYNIQLMILQFGGNVMPYIKNEKECQNYGRWFESQIQHLKNLVPGVSIIVIGPSDMGYIENGKYHSYALLPNVRDALKSATHNQGGVYWDMMEAMGGQNSMEAWVNANPPLAGKDYVHFNLNGAGKIAQLFYNSLIEDYNQYKRKGN